MTTYKPYGISELQELLKFADEKGLPVLTRHQRQDGVGIDFQNWDRIIEIDPQNFTVTAGRAVFLGELEDVLQRQGLHFPAYSEDLRLTTIGDFYGDQMCQLTQETQARYLVQGLEVMLSDGNVISVGGKTVKNVSGYDMCRLYISNRETLAIPLVFLLKIVSQKKNAYGVLLQLSDEISLASLAGLLRQLQPLVCVGWDHGSLALLEQAVGTGQSMLLLLQEKDTQRQREQLAALQGEGVVLQLLDPEQLAACWRLVRDLRGITAWHDGFRVPMQQVDFFMEALRQLGAGFWYLPLQGRFQLIHPNASIEIYKKILNEAQKLGGAGNRYYEMLYGLAPQAEVTLWQALKQQFDPDNQLNPLEQEGQA